MVNDQQQNDLFPVFMKLEKIPMLVVGGGYVATEKLTAIFENSPNAQVKLVAHEICPAVRDFITKKNLPFEERPFRPADLEGSKLVIIAINDPQISRSIYEVCAAKGILTNVADKPELCDFYLGSVVRKGNLKLAISTNGKSPTIAKRVKEVLTDAFPEQIDDLLANMEQVRSTLKGDFSAKVEQLNEITKGLVKK